MNAGNTARFLRTAVALGLGVGAVVLLLAWVAGGAGLGWAFLGWGSAAAIGVSAGAWLVARHGDPGWGFVVALLAGMLARLLAFCIGGALAARSGGEPLWGFVGGFSASFVALQVWEGLFLHRAGLRPGHGGGRRGPHGVRTGVTE